MAENIHQGKLKIKLIKPISAGYYPYITIPKGTILEIPALHADIWVDAGIAKIWEQNERPKPPR